MNDLTLACEWGFRASEKGWNLDQTLSEFRTLTAVATPPAPPDRLQELLDKWQKERACYISGAGFESPVGDMNRASAETVRLMLADFRQLAAVPPVPPPAK